MLCDSISHFVGLSVSRSVGWSVCPAFAFLRILTTLRHSDLVLSHFRSFKNIFHHFVSPLDGLLDGLSDGRSRFCFFENFDHIETF